MGAYLYIDGFDVDVCGQYASAVAHNMVKDPVRAYIGRIHDSDWHVDYGKLVRASGCKDISKIAIYNATVRDEDTVRRYDNVQLPEATCIGALDFDENKIVVDMLEDLYEHILPFKNKSEIILVTRKYSLDYLIQFVIRKQVRCSLMFWNCAPDALKNVASEFIVLDPLVTSIKAS